MQVYWGEGGFVTVRPGYRCFDLVRYSFFDGSFFSITNAVETVTFGVFGILLITIVLGPVEEKQ